ncbi:MAG: Bifunctional synthase/transferase [Candidatus Wolfebacteria bacterium GW2011_GWE1_48_7]|uniref:Bifunctional protein, domain II n=1 Tax=Candidatus Wolfebacteria bacterium GW2011_GWB1_47_1 TaxID=1619007 RepID=A0A0G4AS68_9BACT|nr:MAG: bifunctional protein, domain II [Candidatus Wolfebacteria bacterium GW2011_GWB1_47_1]KKU36158.1 MAG: Bifunctional synthase/transferase [Candidatus Wolfebacteria bacterium GW2011_GWC2_46_275]KKU42158.1 MAG: Bifunctional synthase/transferase [Candidatus Wolfebacteria bacterium GW2011_GWB2_46_69]KKU54066.1 MAG: Bifunctional synthase/transferase [Candidatus Wolfebacteria bacterium GW2011_GWC1_47_103]KKU59253.1 MAG: Bifunctional synthase/transferase [Candidatus Wolfebacteria bacterium GW2011
MHLLDHKKKVVKDPRALLAIVEGLRAQGCRIIVTIGSWDMLHVGHVRYLMKAKEEGDVLIVGTDSDRAIKLYKKNSMRPMVVQDERMEMLSYLECVDLILLLDDVDEEGRWQYGLIKEIQVDTFIITDDSYPPEQIEEIKQYCGEVKMLPRQAETSTSNLVFRILRDCLAPIITMLKERGLV